MAYAHIEEVIAEMRTTDPAGIKKAEKGYYWPMCPKNGDCKCCSDIKGNPITERPGYYEMTPKQIDRELARFANSWKHDN